ncbi:DUF6221 family protein [Actinomadura sp. WMMA1423]|uniref:DUF6221 family protein n=1 Tax=Actinomadura sp. WMMA1423 TaxID=2591108 RepID=UPI0011477392|nr:DUF6221 family protein [Actinomadura sp. WMMA1423]
MNEPLVKFLRAQLDRDERIARAAIADDGGQDGGFEDAAWLDDRTHPLCARIATDAANLIRATAVPRRVLAEVAHKRAVLDRHDWWINRPTETDAELHARCAHPDYEYETTEGPRKAWDEADEPPDGPDGKPDPSWERNVEEGRDGWERFDYIEESYWRRRLPPEKAAERHRRMERPPRELLELAAIYADQPGYRPEWRP